MKNNQLVTEKRINALNGLKSTLDAKTEFNLQQFLKEHGVGGIFIPCLREKGIIEKKDGKYEWVSTMSTEEVSSNLKDWLRDYATSHKKAPKQKKNKEITVIKFVKRTSSKAEKARIAIAKKKFNDEMIERIFHITSIGLKYKVNDLKSFIKECVNTSDIK